MKHTPTPLTVGDTVFLGRQVLDGKGRLYAITNSSDVADHIVKCVNMHDELVEALTRLVREADLDGMREKAGWDCWLSLADKTLKKAGAL